MAGAGYKLFNTGDVLTAAQVNTYLQEQVVMVFASAAARTTALSGVVAEGMMSYLKDTDAVEKYTGSAWVSVGGSSPLTTKGDLYTYSTTDARLGVGTNNQTLLADSAQTTGLKWAASPTSTLTAKGDLLTATAANTIARLGVGTDGQTLVADSSTSTGLKWAATTSGGLTLISETVASAVSSLSFSSLGSYKQLFLVWNGIKHSATGNRFTIRFNSDGNNNYVHSIQGSLTGSSYGGACDSWSGVGEQNFPTFGNNANSSTVADACSGFLLLDNYTSTTKYKFFNAESYWKETSGVTSLRYIGYYADTAAITSIDITQIQGSGTFSNNSNTTVRLYGVS